MVQIECVSPNDGRLLEVIPVTPLATVSKWIGQRINLVLPSVDRSRMLTLLTNALKANEQRLAKAIVEEIGKMPEEASGEVSYAVSFLDSARKFIDTEERDAYQFESSSLFYAPRGLALLITAFNDPVAGITRKLAAAIAAGCPVVVKPSPLGALCAQELDAVMPDELREYVRFAYLDSAADTVSLIDSPGIEIVSMTGSTHAGRSIAIVAGTRAIPCVLELGGNCPMVLFADADLRLAAVDALDRKSRAAGQSCSAINRILIHASIIDQFISEIESLLGKYSCGPSESTDVRFGPVRTVSSQHRLADLEARCIAAGAEVVGRGENKAQSVNCIAYPLTVVRSSPGMPLDFEEAFGPLLCVQSFSTLADLDVQLSPSRQNLAAYFYGYEVQRYLIARPWIRFGSIGINTTKIQGSDLPTGGFAGAGYGREGGPHGVNAFRSTINLRRLK
jgi:acyl-CoA reductase-like NAD-dependent aldehyde dehydrogenase